ncbi:unnamed protein product, partial [Musa acuminata subsp. burmannicoides]
AILSFALLVRGPVVHVRVIRDERPFSSSRFFRAPRHVRQMYPAQESNEES